LSAALHGRFTHSFEKRQPSGWSVMNDVAPTTNVAPMKFGMGANPRRKEDKALITGAGRFVDDYTPEWTLRAWVLRSTMAHARIKVGDLASVQTLPGVRLILTAADVKGLGGLPCKASPAGGRDISEISDASDPGRRHRTPRRRSHRPSSLPTSSSRPRRRRRRSRSITTRCRWRWI